MTTFLINIHPGEILREELMSPLGLSENDLIASLDVPREEITALLAETGPVTEGLARSLAAYFKTSVQLWLGLQAEYEMRMKRMGGRQ